MSSIRLPNFPHHVQLWFAGNHFNLGNFQAADLNHPAANAIGFLASLFVGEVLPLQ